MHPLRYVKTWVTSRNHILTSCLTENVIYINFFHPSYDRVLSDLVSRLFCWNRGTDLVAEFTLTVHSAFPSTWVPRGLYSPHSPQGVFFLFFFPLLTLCRLHGVCKENPLAPVIGRMGLPLYRTSGDNSVLFDHDLER